MYYFSVLSWERPPNHLAFPDGESLPWSGYLCLGQPVSTSTDLQSLCVSPTRRQGSRAVARAVRAVAGVAGVGRGRRSCSAGPPISARRSATSVTARLVSMVEIAGHEEGAGSVLGWVVALIARWTAVQSRSSSNGPEELIRALDIVPKPWAMVHFLTRQTRWLGTILGGDSDTSMSTFAVPCTHNHGHFREPVRPPRYTQF